MLSQELEMALDVATREARSRSHEFLTVEHMLYALTSDALGAQIILRSCGVDVARLKRDLDHYLSGSVERLPEGVERSPQPTLGFQRVLQRAVVHVQSSGKSEADAGDVLAAILQETESTAFYLLQSQNVRRLDVLRFISHGIAKDGESVEELDATVGPEGEGEEADEEEEEAGPDPLRAFTTNLTERASTGELDPVIGRDQELQRTLEILCRRRKNNPLFVGDPGVGKTALAEGLATLLHEGRVPEPLQDAEVFALDTGALLAGTRYRGDFEARLKAVLAAIARRPKAILFIDEVHTTVGAGATSGGSMDLANLLKPVLERGKMRFIGSTTFDEYKLFEKDRALSRRFEKIDVVEPTEGETVRILRGLKSHYERHHGVRFTAGALAAAVRLSARHLHDRRLPDKAIDVIDEAGATLRLLPPSRMRKTVSARDVERVVARMARIPSEQTTVSDRERLRRLDADLKRVVFGQDAAVDALAQAIRRSRAGLGSPDRPVGCFLFTGPTGVGKTELARQLAIHLGNAFHRYDMSEYMEKHAVARLIGAPPGYVGFEQGGLLVDAVRKQPYSVVLMDEIEKAHVDLFSILLQVMDRAVLTDNTGRQADFRQVVLIMTSNAGSREMASAQLGFQQSDRVTERKGLAEVEKLFSPEFRNRLDATIPFVPLSTEVMESIVDKFIAELEAQLTERRTAIQLTTAARSWLAKEGYDPTYGARPLSRVIRKEIKNPLTDAILFGDLAGGGEVEVGLDEGGERLTFSMRPAQGRSAQRGSARPDRVD